MNCPYCNRKLLLKFEILGLNNGKYFWKCGNYNYCNYIVEFKSKYKNYINRKGMGYIVNELLNSLSEPKKQEFILDLKGQMLDILIHYVECKIASCYSSIYRYILIDYLDDEKVLDYFLKSEIIRTDKLPIISSENGAKIFYDLYYDFMLVNSNTIKEYLKREFPKYYNRFINKIYPDQQFSFIDYKINKLIE